VTARPVASDVVPAARVDALLERGPTADARAAVDGLGAAFGDRDLDAALAWFAADGDISYTGSELGESAHGRAAVARLLRELFGRADRYAWTAHAVAVHRLGRHAFVQAEADGLENGSTGFPYRLCGLLEATPAGWRWRAVQGSEPTTCPAS
jgi:hypothetical protein